jgi:hypothetical protein
VVARRTRARLAIFDLQGREVARLVDGDLAEGRHEARWSARDLASGLYFLRLEERDARGERIGPVVSRRLARVR